ncbi:MAG: carboxylate--amine ligase [Planctomycetota bacterium]
MKTGERIEKQTNLRPCVILAEGAIGSIVWMMRSIGSRGVPIYVLVTTKDGKDKQYASIYGMSRYCHLASTIGLIGDGARWGNHLLEWVRGQEFSAKPLLLPLTDMTCTLTMEHRSLLAEEFDIAMPNNEVLLNMLDKTKANRLAQECGLEVPLAGNAGCRDELAKLAEEMNLPVIVKPTWWRQRGTRTFKAERCDTKQQLLTVGNGLIDHGATILIQEYIPGGDDTVEVYMFYRSRDGRTIQGCSGRKIRQIPPGAGSMASGQAVLLPHIVEMSDAFLEKIDYRGLGGIEYKRYNNRSYFIEMSVRPEGFHMLSIKAGVDLPWLAYSDMALGEINRERISQKEAYYITTCAYASLLRRYRKKLPVFREMVKLFFTGKTQFNLWCGRDPFPWIAQTVNLSKEVLTRILRYFGLRRSRDKS